MYWICSLTVRSKSRSGGWLHLAASRPGRRIHGHATVICPRLCFSLRGFVTEAELHGSLFELCFLCQVPEWTKCSSREKRKEKKVEKPFYSDSEGESGPTESADSGNFRGLCWCHRILWSNESITDVFVCGIFAESHRECHYSMLFLLSTNPIKKQN